MYKNAKMMQRISLKWLLFLFYFLFGFFPLITVSYMSLSANAVSIENITKRRMQASLTQIRLRIETQYAEARDDLESFARILDVSLNKVKKDLGHFLFLKKMIAKFLLDHHQFEMICIYSWDSSLMAVADRESAARANWIEAQNVDLEGKDHRRLLKKLMDSDSRFLPLVFDIPQIRHPGDSRTGYILALIPIKTMAEMFFNADLGDVTGKQILDSTGQNIWGYIPDSMADRAGGAKIQRYAAQVANLGWTLMAQIPETVIFRDIYAQRSRNFGLAAVVSIVAALFVFEFSRRTTDQVRHILEGTREFAKGNLAHRIEMPYGKELIHLSARLNKMAKDLEERHKNLVQTNKLASLGLFSAGIVHEIKNPLAGIKTSAQVLEQQIQQHSASCPGSGVVRIESQAFDNAKKLSGGIVSEVNRLNTLLKDLMDFSKPGLSKKQWVDVSKVMERSLSLLQSDLSGADIQVTNQIEAFQAYLDPDQLMQILVNILLNARQAIDGKGGMISISSCRNPGGDSGMTGMRVVIRDNGTGIPEDALDRLFDPFFSLSRKGTGLGLSITYTLAQQNHINIDISNRKTRGAKFVLSFSGADHGPEDENG